MEKGGRLWLARVPSWIASVAACVLKVSVVPITGTHDETLGFNIVDQDEVCGDHDLMMLGVVTV